MKIPTRSLIIVAILAAYILIVLYITLLSRAPGATSIELHPLASYRRAANTQPHLAAIEIITALLNIAMFIPLGILLPALSKCFCRPLLTICSALAFSLLIESAQLITARGVFSLEDLLHNTLGAALGLALHKTYIKIFKNP